MSAVGRDIVLTVTVEGQHYRALIIQEEPTTWFGVITGRHGEQGVTQPLGSIETHDGPQAALQAAVEHIARVARLVPLTELGQLEESPEPAATARPTAPWRRLEGGAHNES